MAEKEQTKKDLIEALQQLQGVCIEYGYWQGYCDALAQELGMEKIAKIKFKEMK